MNVVIIRRIKGGMKMDIERAIEYLEENGYIVIKCTKQMFKDMDDCTEKQDKDCSICSCNICILNQ
jgi:hypothetical protein